MKAINIDLENGKTAWEVQKKAFVNMGHADLIPKIEMMVKVMGADMTYVKCRFDNQGFPETVRELLILSLKYLEYTYKQHARNQ